MLYSDSVHVASSLNVALDWLLTQRDVIERVFVIGGGQIYSEALQHDSCRFVYMTRILQPDFADCDTFFHIPPYQFERLSQTEEMNLLSFAKPLKRSENGIDYELTVYQKQK
jgi:dihydrofolate reductase